MMWNSKNVCHSNTGNSALFISFKVIDNFVVTKKFQQAEMLKDIIFFKIEK